MRQRKKNQGLDIRFWMKRLDFLVGPGRAFIERHALTRLDQDRSSYDIITVASDASGPASSLIIGRPCLSAPLCSLFLEDREKVVMDLKLIGKVTIYILRKLQICRDGFLLVPLIIRVP